MSDIHGCFDEYIKMLELINFSDEDTLYILGDVCDRGDKPMKILTHMMNHKNIIPIWGNHDYWAYKNLIKLYIDGYDFHYDDDFTYWYSDGGYSTYRNFYKIVPQLRIDILRYMKNTFLPYKEVEVNSNKFVLVHGGILNFDEKKPLSEYKLDYLIWERPKETDIYYKDKITIVGHTPTITIDGKSQIIRRNNIIFIDCGLVFGYKLSCLRLEDMKEFYIDKIK